MRRLDGHKRPAKIHQAATQLERVEVASGTLGVTRHICLFAKDYLLMPECWLPVLCNSESVISQLLPAIEEEAPGHSSVSIR